jgi:hypothetical protein
MGAQTRPSRSSSFVGCLVVLVGFVLLFVGAVSLDPPLTVFGSVLALFGWALWAWSRPPYQSRVIVGALVGILIIAALTVGTALVLQGGSVAPLSDVGSALPPAP